jgi:GT2 family glycosyltransferase
MADRRISLAICAYDDDRWDHLLAAVESATQQVVRPHEIIIVIDHNSRLFTRITQVYASAGNTPSVIVVENKGMRGISDARNTAIAASSGELVALLDDDAIAAPNWLARLNSYMDDPAVLAVGGAVDPQWLAPQPWWFPEEFLWVVGCTYRGMPTTRAEVRNVSGGCMLLRRSVAETVGGFRTEIGRIGKRPASCEETELCIRARQRFTAGKIIFEPEARISHVVPAARTRWSYFHSRCYFEGRSKALITRLVGAQDGLASERQYSMHALPAGISRHLFAVLRNGDLRGIGRAATIVSGVAFAAVGYLLERMTLRRALTLQPARVIPTVLAGDGPAAQAWLLPRPSGDAVLQRPERSDAR